MILKILKILKILINMDTKSVDSEIINFPKDESCIDITQPIAYSNVQMIGPTGPIGGQGPRGMDGERGLRGREGPTGPPGRSAPKILSLTESICDTRLPFFPVMFYFPIQNGTFNHRHTVTNSSNQDLIERSNAFSVIFHVNAFVRIEIKLYTYDNKAIMLMDFNDKMIDIGYGPCTNLLWTGYVNSGTRLFIAGSVDNTTEGYWNINVI
jgi:hypothetical protein